MKKIYDNHDEVKDYVILNKFGEYFTGFKKCEPLWSKEFKDAKIFNNSTCHKALSRNYPYLNIESIEI